MKITVTQKHIDEGRRGDCFKCALSLAIHDALPQYKSVNSRRIVDPQTGGSVFVASLRHYEGQGLPDHLLAVAGGDNLHARQFLIDFDVGLPVQPFEFDAVLVTPDPALPSIQIYNVPRTR